MSSGSWYKDLGRNAIDRLNVVTTQNSDRPCKCIKVEDMGFLLSKDRQSGVGNSLRLRSIKTQFFYEKLSKVAIYLNQFLETLYKCCN